MSGRGTGDTRSCVGWNAGAGFGSISPAPMKISLGLALVLTVGGLATSGCATKRDGRVVNTRQPGPAIGTAVGTVAGAVAGNASGAVVGAGEGFAGASSSAFNGERRVVRSWRTETTSDGRTIRVPVEIEVDEYGRPLEAATGGNAGSGTGVERRGPR